MHAPRFFLAAFFFFLTKPFLKRRVELSGGVRGMAVCVCIRNLGLHAKELEWEILAERGITLTNL